MATDWVAAVAKMRGLVGVYLAALAKGPLTAHQAAALETDLKTLDVDLAGLAAALISSYSLPAIVAPLPIVPDFGPSNKISSGLYNDWVSAWVQRSFPEAYRDWPPTVYGIEAPAIIAKAIEDGCLAQVCAAGTIGNPDGPYADKGDWSLFTGLLGESDPDGFLFKLYIMGKLIGTTKSADPDGLPWAVGLGLDAN